MSNRMFSAMLIRGSIVALVLLATSVPFEPVKADGIDVMSCVESFGSFSCVQRWGPAGDPVVRFPPELQQDAESAERERKWAARCRPVVKQDQYGVRRYLYAAPGCEFGRFQN